MAVSPGMGVMSNPFALEPGLEHLVFDTIEGTDLVESPAALTKLFAPASRQLGYSHFAAFSVLDPKGQTIGAYEAGISDQIWQDHYVAQDHFRRDAIVRLMPSTLGGIVWSDLTRAKAISKEESLVFSEAREFGHEDGYVLPQQYISGAVAATILLAPQAIPKNLRLRAATKILSAFFSTGVRRLMAPATFLPVRLSERQRECLQWVRAGKSDWAIGEILDISEHTVKDHIDAARRKLGVRTRTQAVIEAIQQGLISV
jgi:LuxR family transcriptional regulator, quorum-sensing system regulator BjaR1